MFLLHIALEAPLAIQGLFAPQGLPFLDATNTTLVMIKVRPPPPSIYLRLRGSLTFSQLYAALSTASCITALLVFALPGTPPYTTLFQIRS
jgi:hypothetical protein